MPQYVGFNVFGPLSSVLFRNITGHVSVSDQPIDLSGAPELELNGVKGLRNANDQELLSAPLATSGHSADLEFRAVASVRVNGVLETSWIKQHGSVLAIAGAIVAIVSLLFGIFGFLQAMKLWDPRAARV